jgi:hypothetical protein
MLLLIEATVLLKFSIATPNLIHLAIQHSIMTYLDPILA